MSLTRNLRTAGVAEGISFLVLLLIAMPLKYGMKMKEPVLYAGWAHGVLFIVFNLLATIAWRKQQWPVKKWLTAGICSLVPLGTFWFDKQLRD
jgi:integral membrane protein